MNQKKLPNNFDELPIFDQTECHFHLKLNGFYYEIVKGGILSSQLLCIGLNVKLTPQTTVSLCYVDKEMDFCVKAEVIDCQASKASVPQFQIQLRLYPQSEENNSLLLMAIRKYLDQFDHLRMTD